MGEPLPICHLNGEFLPLRDARISPLDRGFLYSDGCYEVTPVYGGRPFRFQQHHDRLAARQQDLQQWFQRRQAELQQQAEQLAVREEELANQWATLQGSKQRWNDDRGRVHEELREVLASSTASCQA